MMDTSLIYVNKGKAKVKNDADGSWLSEVPSVIVNAGDLISVEGIAVATDGTGADVIEIPSQLPNYVYSTTNVKIEFMMYIHANFDYTCCLPLNNQDIYTDQTKLNYGELDPDYFIRQHNQDYTPKNSVPTQRYAGSRMYIGTFGVDGANPRTPSKSTTINDETLGTGALVFNFLTTSIPLSVDSGYNTPQNISSKITEDLHSAMITPNATNDIQTPTNFYEPNLSYATNPPYRTLQATATSFGSSVMTIFGLPNQYFGKTADPTNPYWYSTYSNFLAVKNPFYWYWGSRLQAKPAQGTAKENTWADGVLFGNLTQADIINLNELRNDGTNTNIANGDVMITNLPYTDDAIKKVSKLIHTLKLYQDTYKTQEEMIKSKDDFTTYIPIGKYDDSNIAPYGQNAKLESKVLNLADTASPTRIPTKTYYNDELYESAVIWNAPVGLTIDNSTTLGFLTPKEVAKKYDINIVRVETDLLGVKRPVIGIVLTQTQLANAVIRAGNFVLVDLTLSRDEANACMILSPDIRKGGNKHTLDDMIRGFNVGSPNIELEFSADRSRFAWKQMYWSNYIGNGGQSTEPNPSAGTEAFTSNKLRGVYDLYKPTQLPQLIYNQYAQSGLGFYRMFVQNSTGGYNLIDGEDANDITTKYNGTFLKRIGFEYFDLFGNDYGLPNVIYQERQTFGNSQVEYPQYYPYPLTCNPQLDTAINESINETDNDLPAFNMSLQRNGTDINVAVETAQILARNKPDKLATPYWLIESDIIPAVKYYVEGMPRNVLAICNRAYGSGDFVFSFATDYKFIATKSFVLSHIKCNILTSELLPADIEDNTTIIFKVESPVLPNFVSATEEMEAEEEMRKGK